MAEVSCFFASSCSSHLLVPPETLPTIAPHLKASLESKVACLMEAFKSPVVMAVKPPEITAVDSAELTPTLSPVVAAAAKTTDAVPPVAILIVAQTKITPEPVAIFLIIRSNESS